MLPRTGTAQGVIKNPGDWLSKIVFEGYAIMSRSDLWRALGRLELRGGHSLGHSEPTEADPDEPATV